MADDKKELTPDQLFSEMSKAIGSNDFTALDKLATDDAPLAGVDEVEVVVEEPVKAEEDEPAKAGEEDPNKEETKVEETPAVEETKPEPTAEDKLAALQARLEKQEQTMHRVSSDAGRLAAVQRELDRVKKALEKKEAPAPAREVTRVQSEKLAKIRDSDPLLADTIEELLTGAVDDLRKEQETTRSDFETKLQAKEEEQVIEREYAKLTAAEPNAPQVFKHPLWKTYKETLTPARLAVAESMYADDVLVALQDFAGYVQKNHPELVPAKVEDKKPEPEKVATTPDPVADKVKEERDRKLKTSTPDSKSGAASKVATEQDEEAIFKAAYKEIDEKEFKHIRR